MFMQSTKVSCAGGLEYAGVYPPQEEKEQKESCSCQTGLVSSECAETMTCHSRLGGQSMSCYCKPEMAQPQAEWGSNLELSLQMCVDLSSHDLLRLLTCMWSSVVEERPCCVTLVVATMCLAHF
jgi:hypothetical protein